MSDQAPDDLASQIVDLAVNGMLTDGGHHKQWYLEEIAKLAAGCPLETVEAEDWEGKPYSYQHRTRGPLEARLATERVYFENGDMEIPETNEDYWTIESGVSP